MGTMGSGVARQRQGEARGEGEAPAAPKSTAEAWEAATRAAEAARGRQGAAPTVAAPASPPRAPARLRAEDVPAGYQPPPPVDVEIEFDAVAQNDRPVPAPSAAAASPAPRAAPVSTAGDCRYEAATPFGLAVIEIDARTARAGHALEAAMLLERCEPLLGELDAWFGEPLAWQWCGGSAGRATVGSPALARWRLEAPSGEGSRGKSAHRGALVGRLSLPWAVLRSRPQPPQAWDGWLKWQPVRAVLALSWPRLPSQDMALLEPGGVLLLPESMQARDWRARLRAADEPARPGVGAPLAAAAARATNLVPVIAPHQPEQRAAEARLARSPGAAEADGTLPCEVRLALPKTVPAEWVAGWNAGATLGEAGPVASLWSVSGEGYGRSNSLALGQMMPWGDGWALRIEALKTRRRSAPGTTISGRAVSAAVAAARAASTAGAAGASGAPGTAGGH